MSQHAASVRILVVDDDAMTRDLLCMLLAFEGYEVASANSGDAALIDLQVGRVTPDVVLSDIQMPGISGTLLADAFREACGPHPLLLAMSGSIPSPEAISRFDGFVLKPFTMQDLATSIAKVRAARPPFEAKRASKREMRTQQSEATIGDGEDESVAGPALNEDIFAQLGKSIPLSQLQQMYTMCLDDARARIVAMRRLAAEYNAAEFIRQAHAVKGGAGMLGAIQIYGLAAELETSGLDTPGLTDTESVNPLDNLDAACDRLERILGAHV